jgi:hypothetical protein
MKYITARLKERSTQKAIIVGILTFIGATQSQYAEAAQSLIALILGHTIITPDSK